MNLDLNVLDFLLQLTVLSLGELDVVDGLLLLVVLPRQPPDEEAAQEGAAPRDDHEQSTSRRPVEKSLGVVETPPGMTRSLLFCQSHAHPLLHS
jgi:hypothetical protein